MTVPEIFSLDENPDWPTQGPYEYADHYSSQREVVSFDDFIKTRHARESYDHVIIGAGPIGAALAYKLARDRPDGQLLLIEKSWTEPDRIVGELMQPAGCQAMERLGLGNVFSGIGAVPVHGYHIAYSGRHLFVPYMERPDGHGRFRGNSFHHGRLVMNLRAACKAQANITCLEASAVELIGETTKNGRLETVHGVRLGPSRTTDEHGTSNGPIVRPRGLTFVCDGIMSQFRKHLHGSPVEPISHFCGFVLEHEPVANSTYFDGPTGATEHLARVGEKGVRENPLPMPHNGNVLLDGVGPVLLYQMSECETRVLADIPGSLLPSEAGGHLRRVLRQSLEAAASKSHFPGLQAQLIQALDGSRRIRCIGSRFIPATGKSAHGAVWLGDALNIRHPLTGGGMTVGLWDVVILTDLLASTTSITALSEDPSTLRRIKAQWHWRRRPRALVVNVLSVALHALFAADSQELGLLREACFDYLSRGSRFTMEPSGFLSGLLPSPMLLLFHFFSVAFLAIRLRITGRSTAYTGGSLLVRIYTAFYTLYVAASVILPVMWTELQP
ncbi:SE-domain-containing protein [Coemansia reversa NRRL 1564]|uniref:Squalene monooxygenase n=1 Tax=Coemansia reversa (strain ATCC 12441 / NRRL 1564) TaxID=763665 RepID=A0A2G5B558_COERN|nr:SE-domain-containing protein [Coemansia reversa NRRL 1564]|eukprot:PIA14130.1 SE-domain-containing protein [Coemansia reversa NRRL 1564]